MQIPRRKRLQRPLLWAALPLALMGGCCKPHAGVVPPDDPVTAAKRGLENVMKMLGNDDKDGKLKQSFSAFASTPQSQKPVDGLGMSLSQIVERSTFKEHGFYTTFPITSPQTVNFVADFLNGPTSPLQGWNGWRYRSGVVYPASPDQKGASDMKRAPAAGGTGSGSIVAVVFEATPLVVQK
jgi:hypothetical protein